MEKAARLFLSYPNKDRIGRFIALAVGKQAIQDGQAQVADEDAVNRELQADIWEPAYQGYERKQQTFPPGA